MSNYIPIFKASNGNPADIKPGIYFNANIIVGDDYYITIEPGSLNPAQMIDNTNAQSIASGPAEILLFDNVKFSDSEYTLDPITGKLTFNNADGIKIYEISYKSCVDGVDATGSASRATVTIRALLDTVEILEAEYCVYLREDAYDSTNTSASVSFFVQPTSGQVLTLSIEKNKDSTCEATNRFLNVKRIK